MYINLAVNFHGYMGGKEQICTGKLMYTYLCAEIISNGELCPPGRHWDQTVFQTREDLNGEVLSFSDLYAPHLGVDFFLLFDNGGPVSSRGRR